MRVIYLYRPNHRRKTSMERQNKGSAAETEMAWAPPGSRWSPNINRTRLMLTLRVSWASVPMTTQGFTQNQKQKHNPYYSSDTTVESKRSGSHIPALLSPFFDSNTDGHFETLFQKHNECDFYVSSVAGQWFWLAVPADYWEHKYRAGCIGHDQSIRAGKSEWSTDIIKRQTLGLQWSRYGLQNAGAQGCTMEHVLVCISERQDHIGCQMIMDQTNKWC